MEKKHWELRKLREAIEKEKNWKPAKPAALTKILNYLQGKEKPKPETLDRLALFVGFQSWASFQRALHEGPLPSDEEAENEPPQPTPED